jgi:hypothetical protein
MGRSRAPQAWECPCLTRLLPGAKSKVAQALAVDQIDAANITFAVEHVEVIMRPGAAFARDIGATEDELH